MTFPTFLSFLRIVLAFVIMRLLLLPGFSPKLWALMSFVVAGTTDWLDGYLARRFKQTSALGALLDPIADKILTLGIFLIAAYQGLMPGWMFIVIALREVLITAIRLVAAKRRVVLAAASEGKQKMVSQVAAILMLLIFSLLQAWPNPAAISPALMQGVYWLTHIALWITVVLTLFSGSLFFWRHRLVLKRLAVDS